MNYFCTAPFIHIHTWPDGRVFPCCMVSMDTPIGNLNHNSLKEIWNNDEMKRLRMNMLNNKPSSLCNRCYELEHSGSNSVRQHMNKHFNHHTDIFNSTHDDGTLDNMDLKYIDFRFSNICNFKCRTCGPHLSSSWYDDQLELYGEVDGKKIEKPDGLWEQVVDIIPHAEEIYFAGGEPLIMEEHYRILKLLDSKKAYHIKLRYNTNFSILKFKDLDVIELWKKFDYVSVGASIDATNKLGEYIRYGMNYDNTVINAKRLKRDAPNVEFFISPTLSILNCFNMPELHKDWLEMGLIDIHGFNINHLLEPRVFRTQVLNLSEKEKFKNLIVEHINYLETNYKESDFIIDKWKAVIDFTFAEDLSNLKDDMFKRLRSVDNIRNQKMEHFLK